MNALRPLMRKVIVCLLVVSFVTLVAPRPLGARDSAAIPDFSFSKAIIVAAVGAGTLFGLMVLPGLLGRGGHLKLEATPRTLRFTGSPGDAGNQRVVLLTAKGKGALVITDVSVSGECFSLAQTVSTPVTLSNKESARVPVAFAPKASSCVGELSVAIQGTGKGPGRLVIPLAGRGQ